MFSFPWLQTEYIILNNDNHLPQDGSITNFQNAVHIK
jgi:hypothetical protein